MELFITEPSSAQKHNSSVMNVRVEVVDGLTVQAAESSGRILLQNSSVPYGVFSLRSARGTEMLIRAQKDVEMRCKDEIWTMKSELAVKEQSNGTIVLGLNTSEKFVSRSKGLHRGTQSLIIEYL
ncbi:hypothetical protein [Rhodohalobacter mucosus]|uniref:hypothetical protein n=1 Tax=Rhodohalobacter mucosus TaxID=2079485 RepID=UPI0011B23A80|nr:hypothetical protein [Rhodohalobacter mucosus]